MSNYSTLYVVTQVLFDYVEQILLVPVFTLQPLRAVWALFSPMMSRWAGGRREKACLGCFSETVRCKILHMVRTLIGVVGVQHHSLTFI